MLGIALLVTVVQQSPPNELVFQSDARKPAERVSMISAGSCGKVRYSIGRLGGSDDQRLPYTAGRRSGLILSQDLASVFSYGGLKAYRWACLTQAAVVEITMYKGDSTGESLHSVRVFLFKDGKKPNVVISERPISDLASF